VDFETESVEIGRRYRIKKEYWRASDEVVEMDIDCFVGYEDVVRPWEVLK
jgi:hypothetical protein